MAEWLVPTHCDRRGCLSVLEGFMLPFQVKRVFWIWDVPPGAERAGHAHKRNEQLLVAVSGAVTVLADGTPHRLDSPNRGLYVPPGVWCELQDFEPGAVVLVLCSRPYEPEDYLLVRQAEAVAV